MQCRPRFSGNQLGEAEEQVGELAKGISCPQRWTQTTMQIHSHTGQISGSPTPVQATEISNSASHHMGLFSQPYCWSLHQTTDRRREPVLVMDSPHHLEMAEKGLHISFTQHIAATQPLDLVRLLLGSQSKLWKAELLPLTFNCCTHYDKGRHLLKETVCLNIPHREGITWVLLAACYRMLSSIVLSSMDFTSKG